MESFSILLTIFVSIIIGIILTLSVQYYLIHVYFNKSPIASSYSHKKTWNYSLPNSVKEQLDSTELKDNKGGIAINLILQFLFFELRHSESVRRWMYKKLTLEFEELTKTAMGKFFDSITINDMHLGTQIPNIKDVIVDNVKMDTNEQHLEVVSIGFNVEYSGNFHLCIDARMKFGKAAYVSIKVKKISGRARLEFSRQPYTHWSFSFYNEPVVDLTVESQFQGRQLQSNITNLIMNQIKKAIKRKHTLPNYQIRYKPFFVKIDPSQLDAEDNETAPQGTLDVNIVEISRLAVPEGAQHIYLTIGLDTIPWISVCQKENDVFIMTLEITIAKPNQSQFGVIFHQEVGYVSVDSIKANSNADQAGLKPLDVVISVENNKVTTVPQVARYLKSVSGSNVTLRVERVVDNYILKRKNVEEKETVILTTPTETKGDDSETELIQTEQESFVVVEKKEERSKPKSPKIMPSNENMVKFAQSIGSTLLRKRRSLHTLPGTPQKSKPVPVKKNSVSDLPDIVRTEFDSSESEQIFSSTEIFRGKEMSVNDLLSVDDDFHFTSRESTKYLNINAWATVRNSPDVLLGYLNLPLSHIVSECAASILGHYSRRYCFLPQGLSLPAAAIPLRTHSGFEYVFCFGDVLLTFEWNPINSNDEKRKSSTVIDHCKVDTIEVKSKHDFVRTQFSATIHCDFCSKKIWLKDAFQCRKCGLCCHKKCMAKCQLTNKCNGEQPMQTPNDVSMSDTVLQPDATSTEEIETSASNLKRVNSVTCLAIPGAVSFSSRSLPPSPQRTPSRKQSLVAINPFMSCPIALDDLRKNSQDASEIVSKLIEQVMQCPNDEDLMNQAKECGQKLYVTLPLDEKVEKINLMMAELKKSLDNASFDHMELTRKLNSEDSEVEKTKLAFLIGQADAKVQALAVLMLHYCSGLQYSQEKII